MAAFKLFHEFGKYLGEKNINLTSDTIRAALTNTAPTQATGVTLTSIAQISATYGYTAVTTTAGATVSMTWAETGAGTGIWQWGTTASDVTFTATGGAMPQFRYIVIVDTSYIINTTDCALIGYLDYGSAVDLTSSTTFTVDSGSSGFFQLTIP